MGRPARSMGPATVRTTRAVGDSFDNTLDGFTAATTTSSAAPATTSMSSTAPRSTRFGSRARADRRGRTSSMPRSVPPSGQVKSVVLVEGTGRRMRRQRPRQHADRQLRLQHRSTAAAATTCDRRWRQQHLCRRHRRRQVVETRAGAPTSSMPRATTPSGPTSSRWCWWKGPATSMAPAATSSTH